MLVPHGHRGQQLGRAFGTLLVPPHEYRVLKTPIRSGFTCIFYSKLIQSRIVGKGASIFRLTVIKPFIDAYSNTNLLSYLAANKHGHWFIIDIDWAAKQSPLFLA